MRARTNTHIHTYIYIHTQKRTYTDISCGTFFSGTSHKTVKHAEIVTTKT